MTAKILISLFGFIDLLFVGLNQKLLLTNLQVLFIGLKLAEVIKWDWVLVMSPMLVTMWYSLVVYFTSKSLKGTINEEE